MTFQVHTSGGEPYRCYVGFYLFFSAVGCHTDDILNVKAILFHSGKVWKIKYWFTKYLFLY